MLCATASKVGLIPLVCGRTQVVFGAGAADADLMFIGEGPGEDEDRLGEPFVGKKPNQAGAKLDERLQANKIRRDEVFITNVVMCRPTRIDVNGVKKNRAPEPCEIQNCATWLADQALLVNPKVVVPLGVPAANQVLGWKVTMRDVHGQIFPGEGQIWGGRVIIPTYHPSGGYTQSERDAFRDDFETIGEVYRQMKRQG